MLAVEPSAAMRARRPSTAAPALDAVAEHLPFDDDGFDAAMAIVTIPQWRDVEQGLREMCRVARGPVVVLTSDAAALQIFWAAEHLPEVMALERERFAATDRVERARRRGADVEVDVVPVPRGCGEAYSARRVAFLRPDVRAATAASR